MRSKDFAKASGKLVGTSMRSKDLAKASGKLVGTSMRSKDLAKASGLAVVFDLTAHTFYRLSPSL